MKIAKLTPSFSICKLQDFSRVNFEEAYCFAACTDEEKSLVCPRECVPENALVRDDGWRAFRIQETLDFSLVGILSKISGCLAENGIGLFAVSTFNTDYILVKEENFERALSLLMQEGFEVIR